MANCALPDRVRFGDGTRPTEQTPEVSIRASLLRRLLLNDIPSAHLHSKGLRLQGAWIDGVLDLQGSDLGSDVSLSSCSVRDGLNLVNAQMRGLYLSDVASGGISADNARFAAALYFRGGTEVQGEISLAGARIEGDLQLCGVTLNADQEDAVFAPSLRVEGSIFLGDYPYNESELTLVAKGRLFFSSARVANDLFVSRVSIGPSESGKGRAFFGAPIMDHERVALSLARSKVEGILLLQNNQISGGMVNLSGAHVGRLKDEITSGDLPYLMRLDGFRYDAFSRRTDISLQARLPWLDSRPDGTPFVAQPYEQLADVLSKVGHRDDARTVLMTKEGLLRAENRRLLVEAQGLGLRWLRAVLADFSLKMMVGYGYRPARAAVLALVLVLALGAFFDRTWSKGDMTPNAAPILISKDWIAATKSHPDNPAEFWSAPGQAGQDWETFNAYAYAADLIIPLVSLGQESAWAPSTSRSNWGRAGWWLRWVAKFVGWIVTALGAAALTGIIRQD
ncbi:MAG: hypothetical protein AAGD04_06830 [Pseudomonadota bacterium]